MNATDDGVIERLQAKVDAARVIPCGICRGSICGHQLLFSVALGLADTPYCLDCAASELNWPAAQLRNHLHRHFQQRECYSDVWRRENEREGFAADALPSCLWSDTAADDAAENSERIRKTVQIREASDVVGPEQQSWDAGDLSCGDLTLQLRQRVTR